MFSQLNHTTSLQLHVNTTSEAYLLPDALKYPVITFLSIVLILTISLNLLSFICIVNAKAFNPINLLLMNLSISQIIYTLNMPTFAAQFIKGFAYSSLICQISILADVLSLIVNVYTIAALTLERYFCLRDSTKTYNDKFKTLIIIVFIIFLWIVALVFALPKTLSIVETPEGEIITTWSSEKNMIYFSFTLFLFFIVPYAIIILFSISILIFLKKWAEKSKKLTSFGGTGTAHSNSTLSGGGSGSKAGGGTLHSRTNMIKRRTTSFVLAIVISYLITWSPLWAFQIYNEFSSSETHYIMIINSIVFVVNYSSGIINPLLFMLLTQNFREYFAKLKYDVKRFFKRSDFDRELKERSSTTKRLLSKLPTVQTQKNVDDFSIKVNATTGEIGDK